MIDQLISESQPMINNAKQKLADSAQKTKSSFFSLLNKADQQLNSFVNKTAAAVSGPKQDSQSVIDYSLG